MKTPLNTKNLKCLKGKCYKEWCDTKEEWKWIDGYEGLYKISNKGNVLSFHKKETGKLLSIKNSKGWYLSFGAFNKKCQRKTLRIHMEVAKAFIGEIPEGYHVHHKDGNKQNNVVTNLEILNPIEHIVETMKSNPNHILGMKHYNMFQKPKKIQQYTLDGHWVADYVSAEIAGKMTGVCSRNILQVANKSPFNSKGSIRKQAGGYIWKFADMEEVV